MTTVGVTNMTQACIDGISDTVAGMQTTTDPFASQSESLATSGAGEIQRLRFMFQRMFGLQDWYRHDSNVNFAHAGGGINVQGSGVGRHVLAVGLHVWSGFRQGAPRPGQFPAITSVDDHWTGLAFPAAGHVSLVVGNPLNGLVQGGVESLRWHAAGITLHHTAAIRFAHSTAQMDGGQRGHVPPLQIHQGLPGAGGPSDDDSKNDAAYKDSIVLGHATVGLMIHGTGITGGANRLYGLSADGRFMETKQISGTLTVSHQAGQIVFGGGTGALPVFHLTPLNAIFGTEKFPVLARHNLANSTAYGLMFDDATQQYAHFYAAIPSGVTFTRATMDIYSRQGTRTSGTVGWHVGRSEEHTSELQS